MLNRLKRNLLEPVNQHLMAVDALIFVVTPILSLLVRLDGWDLVQHYSESLALATIIFVTLKLTVLTACGFYRRYWRFAGVDELAYFALLTMVFTLVQSIALHMVNRAIDLPLNILPNSLPLLDGLFSFLLVGTVRFSIPFAARTLKRSPRKSDMTRVLVFGAGSAGISLVREMQSDPDCGFQLVGFMDDDPRKLNFYMGGLRVWGDRYRLAEIVQQQGIDRVIIAIPSAAGQVIREVVSICRQHGVKTSTLPGIHEILDGRVRPESVRDIKIEDLLRREPIQTELQAISAFLHGKTVLVTGAGGSIGSELCRQIYKCQPAIIVLLGHGENSVFNIQQELESLSRSDRPNHSGHPKKTQLISWIADLRSPVRLDVAFEQFKPDVVFHAAAHKHVPLMEANPAEAVSNNVQGTKNLTEVALRHGVSHFVMISTDKAVHPTSVMGATKRVAEMLVLKAAQKSGRAFVVVRFGNVLGSRGSVIPTFTRQIAAGGPVTVTHPNMCRYFMTIPEAVQLVLQASVMTHKGQILMLNMGQPVKIVDLAADLIRLSGYEVGKDIDIVFTGTRPGEKLFEELLIPGENYESTQHEKLLVVKNASEQLPERLLETADMLCAAAAYNNDTLTLFLLEQLVAGYKPTYPSVEINTTAIVPDTVVLDASNVIPLYGSRGRGSDASFFTAEIDAGGDAGGNAGGYSFHHGDLQQAILRQELKIFYQPIMLLEQDHIITSFEALLRWYHPQKGLMTSAAFIPLAETTDIIYEIGWWGLAEVCTQLNAWKHLRQTRPPIAVSVNLSQKQLRQPDFIARMQETIHQTAVDVSQLRLEIPEQFISHNPDFAIPTLLQLKGMGLHLQIDNFGHSSLKSLAPLSEWIHIFDSLKIDRSRVQQLGSNQGVLDFFHTALDLSQQFGMDIIAMGIETPRQVMQLKTLQCKYGQGYFFLKPISGREAKTLMGVSKGTTEMPTAGRA
jgi:FlaA1/EpsC-like NDP-sugar epimerase/EAL domain-containing protein (putative c-di-GMP-specific phosphodiesterase class I)